MHDRLTEIWDGPPGPLGWFEVDEHGALSKAQKRGSYRLVPVESEDRQ